MVLHNSASHKASYFSGNRCGKFFLNHNGVDRQSGLGTEQAVWTWDVSTGRFFSSMYAMAPDGITAVLASNNFGPDQLIQINGSGTAVSAAQLSPSSAMLASTAQVPDVSYNQTQLSMNTLDWLGIGNSFDPTYDGALAMFVGPTVPTALSHWFASAQFDVRAADPAFVLRARTDFISPKGREIDYLLLDQNGQGFPTGVRYIVNEFQTDVNSTPNHLGTTEQCCNLFEDDIRFLGAQDGQERNSRQTFGFRKADEAAPRHFFVRRIQRTDASGTHCELTVPGLHIRKLFNVGIFVGPIPKVGDPLMLFPAPFMGPGPDGTVPPCS